MRRCWLYQVAFLVVCLLMALPAHAQIGNANLTGFVRDNQGAPLPGVTVSIKNPETGLERTDVTDENGAYRVSAVPVGVYDITAQLGGFATQVQKGIRLDVGRTVSIDFSMKLSATSETIEISGEAPLIETTQSHVATVVTPEEVNNLPLNGRQFANLGALAPGTTLTVHPDPTRPSNLAISMIGGSGRNMNVTVDGGDNNDDTVGGINQFYSLESISEFNLLTNRYKAEYGRSSGGVLNVVTKSGTNDFHGSGFSLFRDTSLDAKTKRETDNNLDKAAYTRQQYGGSFGGPIVKDRAHFFGAIERVATDQESTLDMGTVAPELTGQVVPVPTRDTMGTAKFTMNVDPKQYLSVRYGQQKTDTAYAVYPNYAPNARGTLTNTFHSLLASHNYVLSGDKLNEFVFQYADFHNIIAPTSQDPTELFPSGYALGQNINTPQETIQKKYQFRDDFSFHKGKHNFKSGINFVHEPTLEGTFSTGIVPQFYHLGDTRDSPIYLIQQYGGQLNDHIPNNQYGLYFQDDWNVNSKLTLNVGLRYDYVTGFNLNQSSNTIFAALKALPYSFPWLKPVQASSDGVVQNDKNNVAPRVGFAYDLKGDGKTVFRGGWGLYYDFPYTNANLLFPASALGNYGVIYSNTNANGIRNPDGSFYQVGQPLPPNQLPGLESAIPNEFASPDFVIPYTNQFSIGASRQVHKNAAIDVDYIHVAVRDQFVRFRINGVVNGQQLLPAFGNVRFWYNGGYSDYNGLNLSYRHRLSKGLEIQAAYTLSRVKGDTLPGSDEFRLGSPTSCRDCTYNFQIGPKEDSLMYGPLNTDATHRLVLAAVTDLPYDIRLSGFFRVHSAFAYSAFTPVDLNGDGFPYDPPNGNEAFGSHREAAFSQLDLRVSKIFNIKNLFKVEGIFEVFNLFNAKNPVAYGRAVGSANFEQATQWAGDPNRGEQRLAQLGFRIEF